MPRGAWARTVTFFDRTIRHSTWVGEQPHATSHVFGIVQEALKRGESVFGEFLVEPGGEQTLHLAAPVREKDGGPVLGILIFDIDPVHEIFPLLTAWTSASRTAEALIVHREGNQVRIMTPQRFPEFRHPELT